MFYIPHYYRPILALQMVSDNSIKNPYKMHLKDDWEFGNIYTSNHNWDVNIEATASTIGDLWNLFHKFTQIPYKKHERFGLFCKTKYKEMDTYAFENNYTGYTTARIFIDFSEYYNFSNNALAEVFSQLACANFNKSYYNNITGVLYTQKTLQLWVLVKKSEWTRHQTNSKVDKIIQDIISMFMELIKKHGHISVASYIINKQKVCVRFTRGGNFSFYIPEK